VLIQTWPIGEYQIWPIPILGDKPKHRSAAADRLRAFVAYWVGAGPDARNYNVEVAENNKNKPTWPQEPFTAF
jgi:hypothetical protein